MNKKVLLRKIKEKAEDDKNNRKDPRFLHIMGLLVAKGFLQTNYSIRPLPNKKVCLEDAIWAGKNVEPRILEVLPAATLRLHKHFDMDINKYPELAHVIDQLRKHQKHGDPFLGMAYDKIKIWADFPLKDRRVKTTTNKKITKTFRLKLETVLALKQFAEKWSCTETEVLERKIGVSGIAEFSK